jgi:hypothetical protein
MSTQPFDENAHAARYDSLKEVPVTPMGKPFEMTERWQALTLPDGLHRGLCLACMDSGFVHEVRDGRRGVISHQGKLLRCSCMFGLKIDAQRG